MKAKFLVPLFIFLLLAGFLGYGLKLNPREVPSPLIGKPAPAFRVPQLQAEDKFISPEDLKGRVWLLNVWASWCISCRYEHPVLVDFARTSPVPIIGLNYKEVRGDGALDVKGLDPATELTSARQRARQWLVEHGGDPYMVSAVDLDGRIGIDYGVYGVPETFLIDQQGVIRYKHIGPITPESLRDVLIPKIAELQRAS
ncbi:MAG: DsbE family thiol:disulfide interchange protein [Pseudomonas sagittaria]|uniref:DsbE family thiol:disulfide interchange protein n=1 Tax=Aromatoleum sp. (strain CIB) TaxID=198107 RepID=UPI00067CF70B|nr:DsbE family thiol:disulfide interchange protein [Azoarcus sp. CIB]AKU10149.1 protein disulfide-isomerase [Azoarcus sp. CIB]MCM2331422.1 DsbE family thiol:disulfide interchange protein [Pseudomonas sagittaria]